MLKKIKELNMDEIVCYIIVLAACLKLPIALQDIGNIAYMVAIICSLVYLVWKLIWKKELLKNSLYIWGIILCILFMLSSVFNGSLFMVRNIRACICGVIFFLVLVPQNGIENEKMWRRRSHCVNMIVICSTMLYAICMLLFIFFKGSFYLINFSGSKITIGWNVGRIMGIYAEGSLAGYASFLSFAVSLVELVLQKNNKKINILLWINIVIETVCVAISCSRGAYLSLLMVLFLFVYNYLKVKQKRIPFLTSAGITVIVGGMLLGGGIINSVPGISIKPFCVNLSQGTFNWEDDAENEEKAVSMLYRITTGEQTVKEDDSLENKKEAEEAVEKKETDESEGQDKTQVNGQKEQSKFDDILYKYSSGRSLLWKTGIEKLKGNPWFGCGLYREDNFSVDTIENEQEKINVVNYISMHNDFIQAYVSGGIIGGTLFLLYLIYILFNVFKCYHKAKIKTDSDKMKIGAMNALICGVLFTSMTLTVIYFDGFATGAVFWCYLGLIYSYVKILCKKSNKEKELEKQ